MLKHDPKDPTKVIRRFICPICGCDVDIQLNRGAFQYQYWHADFVAFGGDLPDEDTYWFCNWVRSLHGSNMVSRPPKVPLRPEPVKNPEQVAMKKLLSQLGLSWTD